RRTRGRLGPMPAPTPRLAPRRAAALVMLAAAAAPLPARAAESLRVEIEGISGDLRKNALANLTIETARKDKDLDESRIRRLHGQAPEEIQQALQPFGYYRVVVDGSLTHEGATWVAHYKVEEGPQLKVTSRDLQVLGDGASDAGFQQVEHAFPLHEGEALLQIAYEAGKKAFDDYAAANGYLDAKFQVSQIQVDLATYTSSIVLHYQTGPQYRFGPVRFNQHLLRLSLLRGYVRWKEGDPLSAHQLLLLQESLADSTYFQRVEVVPRRDEAVGVEVPIDVNLVPARPQKWSAGLGYGTDTGPRASLGLELRHLNELGHRFTSEGKVSLVEKSFRADYLIPGAYPRTDVLDFTAAYADLRPKTSHSENLLVGPSYSFSLGRWRQAVALDYQRETYTVGVDKGTSALVIPQDTWTRVYADDRVYPSHGEKYTFIVRGGAKALASDVNFVQASADAKFVQSLDQRRRFRLISRANVGYTATSDFRHLPPTERFFAGGDQSVRGYGYQGIGARDVKGNVIGGPDTVVGSVEVEYRLERWQALQKFGVAAFYDAGTAGFSFGGGMKQGTGLGIFWISPIGLVRVYVATALSLPGHPLRLHLTIGPDL
ncbi:MAG TPA: autotransporter assembly complex family protein, partial [Thermoanaerobaculia bacterium]|nr:autotransporter assembly complex family protein [Thermoanaerobaculia bacterium]